MKLTDETLRNFLNTSGVVDYWKKIIESFGVPVGPPGQLTEPLQMCTRAEIFTTEQLEKFLKRSKKWGKKYLKQFYLNTWGIPPKTKGVSSDLHAVVVLLLIGGFPNLFTETVLEKSHGFGLSWRAVEASRAALTPAWWWSREAKIAYISAILGAVIGVLLTLSFQGSNFIFPQKAPVNNGPVVHVANTPTLIRSKK